jgi:hypothetical protein
MVDFSLFGVDFCGWLVYRGTYEGLFERREEILFLIFSFLAAIFAFIFSFLAFSFSDMYVNATCTSWRYYIKGKPPCGGRLLAFFSTKAFVRRGKAKGNRRTKGYVSP